MHATTQLLYLTGVYPTADHLNSTSLVMNAAGAVLSEQRYPPFGQVRIGAGSLPSPPQAAACGCPGQGWGGGPQYLTGDHLSSPSLVMDAAGAVLSEQRFTPFGQVRAGPSLKSVYNPARHRNKSQKT